MTEKQKSRTEWIPKLLTPALLITLVVTIFNFGKEAVDIKSKTFDSVNDKVKTKKHIDHSPNDVDVYKEFLELQQMKIDDSILKLNAKEAIKSRRTRDKRDSVEAVENWKMSQAIQKINEKLNINN